MTTSVDVESFLSTLRRLDHELLALGSPPNQTWRLLYLSMTSDQRLEAIGRLERLNPQFGNLLPTFLLTEASQSCSKTASMIFPSSGERMGSE